MLHTIIKHITTGLYSLLVLCLLQSCAENNAPPATYGAIPLPAQMEWQKMEYYMFIHFGPNTFTDVEWGDGKEDPKVFNPTRLDCRQWAATAKAAGMKAIIITAKHHDGFCLWPSQYSTHTVRESAWKDGKGDVLKELRAACDEYGLKFGVYLSPWDQNHPSYGTPEYNQLFANTLAEVYANYGGETIFEQWFDGANGEGPNGKKQVYDWDLFHQTVFKSNPHSIIFSDIGPGCRWMGNEKGEAGETNWSTLNVKGFGRGHGAPKGEILNSGNVNGEAWVPAETDVSIRPGWFYSPSTDSKIKSIEKLTDIYYSSVGRNSNLLLNVPANREGRISAADSTRLMEFRQAIEEDFAQNLALGATAQVSETRHEATKFGAANLLDGMYDSYWSTNDPTKTAWIELSFKAPQTFNRLLLQEYIPLGQRVEKFSVEYQAEASPDWIALTQGTTIGYKRILRFPAVTGTRIRINIQSALACPALNNLEVYNAPDRKEIDAQTSASPKAAAWKLTVISPKTNDAGHAADGNPTTISAVKRTTPIEVELGEAQSIKGFSYTPSPTSPAISRYNLFVSPDGNTWTQLKKDAVFNNIKNNPIKQDIVFDAPVKAKRIKLEPVVITEPSSETYSVAEVEIIAP